jgi:uncharacterized membrane protein YfcA
MRNHRLLLCLILGIAAPAFAQHRGSSAGAATGLFFGMLGVIFLAFVLAAIQRSFRSFFPMLGGLAIMFSLSAGGASVAESVGWVQHDSVVLLAASLFAAMLLGPAVIMIFSAMLQKWWHRRRAGA